MQLGALRRAAIERLRKSSESPALDADLLLCAALGLERAALLAHLEDSASEEAEAQIGAWLERAAAGEPIAYILGARGFYDLDFLVTPAVLIPRPETELLLEQALAWAADHPVALTADIGTGSGALAVTFAAHVPSALVVAVDASPDALEVAEANAARHGVLERVTFLSGDLYAPIAGRSPQPTLVMANLPYIPSGDVPGLAVSRHEPQMALDGGPDGLDLVRRLMAQMKDARWPGGLLLLEIGAGQGSMALEAVRAIWPEAEAAVLPDYAGHDRIVRVALC